MLVKMKVRIGEDNSENLRCLIFFFVVLGLELRAYTFSHSTSTFFVVVFFLRQDFMELFVQAGFELQSS
jgi:hypothetical protein